MDDPAVNSATTRRLTGERAVITAALVIAVLGILVRFVGLSRQAYWSDEMFSVTQASSSFRGMAKMGSTEIHPPLFACLAWAWQHLGHSVRPHWMRVFPAVCGAGAVAAAWWGLRRSGVTGLLRALMVSAISVSGMAIVYSQEMRSYSLLFLAAVGVTAASLSLLLPQPGRRALVAWTMWGALASATHLFGGLLVAACAVCVWAFTRRSLLKLAVALALAELPQILWMVHGAFTPGFSEGADWIPRPGASDVWELLTSVFGVGRLEMRPDGFRMTSPWGVIAVGALLSGAVLARAIARRGAPSIKDHQDASSPESSRALRFLLALSLGFVTVMFLVSQVVHLWTLRNMIVVAPALLWASVLGVMLLVRTSAHRRLLSVLVVAGLAAGLGTATHALRAPYKGELSQSMNRLAQLRRQYPGMQVFQSRTSYWWLYSSRLQPTPHEYRALMNPFTTLTSRYGAGVAPAAPHVPTLYILYTSSSQSSSVVDDRILAHNRRGCQAEPFQYVAFVFCAP